MFNKTTPYPVGTIVNVSGNGLSKFEVVCYYNTQQVKNGVYFQEIKYSLRNLKGGFALEATHNWLSPVKGKEYTEGQRAAIDLLLAELHDLQILSEAFKDDVLDSNQYYEQRIGDIREELTRLTT